MPRLIDLGGRAFGRLTVVGRAGSLAGRTTWRCRCACGAYPEIRADALRSGATRSCGCLKAEATSARLRGSWNDDAYRAGATVARVHGHARKSGHSAEYRAWNNAKTRCDVPGTPYYADYGGRGITMAAEWRDSFEAFLRDVGPRPSASHSLDRYPDNDGPYTPGNVRWATRSQQSANQRPRRKRSTA